MKTIVTIVVAWPAGGATDLMTRGVQEAFAKALGQETGRPTVILDVGALMGSLVGQSEERTRAALRSIDALAPCVCVIDEVEKAFAAAGQGAVPSVMTAPVVLPDVLGPSTPASGSGSAWKSASWAKDLTQRLQGLEVRSVAPAETGGGVVRTALRAFLKR